MESKPLFFQQLAVKLYPEKWIYCSTLYYILIENYIFFFFFLILRVATQQLTQQFYTCLDYLRV